MRDEAAQMPCNLGVTRIKLCVRGSDGKRLPQLGRQLGGGVREFKDTVTAKADKHFDDDDSGRGDAPAALNRPGGEEEQPLDGEVMRERS